MIESLLMGFIGLFWILVITSSIGFFMALFIRKVILSTFLTTLLSWLGFMYLDYGMLIHKFNSLNNQRQNFYEYTASNLSIELAASILMFSLVWCAGYSIILKDSGQVSYSRK
ncbi:hypothetical protein MNBD_GAMMA12-3605 [hydrothermal vent metagenome]|uniref:Uncharacterized protein n=1 Tax=hydrothermal vent metagenome TaxID=652676 RepID=A0A3B0Z0B8_9ZZZZ